MAGWRALLPAGLGLLWTQANLVSGTSDGLGLTPAMGFNTWNQFGCRIDEDLIRTMAKAIKDKGLLDAGYRYMNLDDCWSTKHRTRDGKLEEDKTLFPSGMLGLGEWLRSQGFLFGIYSSAGTLTCAGYPASLDHEFDDAKTFASWGVDYVKYDNCYNDSRPSEERFPVMAAAIRATGRPMMYSLCQWGINNPGAWAQEVGHSWRTTLDISDHWDVMLRILDVNARRWRYAGPGHFNDPDMLEVGNGGMTVEEYRSHMSLWSAMKSPLLIGCDVRSVSREILDILGNKEVIAINQDKLGIQARRIWSSKSHETPTFAIAAQCADGMGWTFDNDHLVNENGHCLTRRGHAVTVEECSSFSDMEQRWELSKDKLLQPVGSPQLAVEVVHTPATHQSDATLLHEGITLRMGDATPGANEQTWLLVPPAKGKERPPRLVNQWQKQCLETETDAPPGNEEVWLGPLVDGAVVVLFNRNSRSETISADWKMLGLVPKRVYEVRDVWAHTSTTVTANGDAVIEAKVPAHGVAMFRLTSKQCPKVLGIYKRLGRGRLQADDPCAT